MKRFQTSSRIVLSMYSGGLRKTSLASKPTLSAATRAAKTPRWTEALDVADVVDLVVVESIQGSFLHDGLSLIFVVYACKGPSPLA